MVSWERLLSLDSEYLAPGDRGILLGRSLIRGAHSVLEAGNHGLATGGNYCAGFSIVS